MGRLFSQPVLVSRTRAQEQRDSLIGNGKNAEAPRLQHSFGFLPPAATSSRESCDAVVIGQKKKYVVLRKQSFPDSCTSCQTRHRSRQT